MIKISAVSCPNLFTHSGGGVRWRLIKRQSTAEVTTNIQLSLSPVTPEVQLLACFHKQADSDKTAGVQNMQISYEHPKYAD